MTNKKLIINAIDSALNLHGFKKKADNWYCHNTEIIQMVNLQKSDYGGQFYLNFGILIRALSDVEFPKEENCHIRFRLHHEDIGTPENKAELLLDLENKSFIDEYRVKELSSLIASYVVPIFEKCSTMQGVTEIVKNEKYNHWAVRKSVKDLIS